LLDQRLHTQLVPKEVAMYTPYMFSSKSYE
jgi:hypothetical protein